MIPPVLEKMPTPPNKTRPFPMDGQTLKLMLGGRDQRIDGFLNMDVHIGDNVDISGDISDLSRFSNGSVSEIYASHCLEHFPHVKTVDVLKEWRRVMAKGGKTFISVPNMDYIVNHYCKFGLTDWFRNIAWGDQGYKEAFHYTGFNFAALSNALFLAGYEDIVRINQMPYGLNDCSTKVMLNDGQNFSLHVEAKA